uniref:F-box domain-containing protein n=1 Tax=Globodera rostochiensis TaxID=31243 RepID=A0A914HFF5_GLORO
MSDNTSDEEQQQQMEEISICGDIWLEIFALFSPLELGHTMALISDRFDARVDEHFKTRKWSLGTLQIVRSTNGNGAQIVNNNNQQLPIPQRPLPNKVIGFEKIEIRYIDRSVIEFLQSIRRLFNSSGTTVAIATSADQSRSWDIIRQKIWPLINDNIRHLRVCVASQLDRLRQDFPAILRNCTKLRLIGGLSHAFPAEDNANASSAQAVAKWLLTPREGGRSKILFCRHHSGKMEELKRAFVNASEPANFIIYLHSYGGIEPFELNNNLGERLELRCFGEYKWLLVRCPIGREEAIWAGLKKAATAVERQGFRQWNCIDITFGGNDIGDGMLDANDEGPSEPKK